MATHSLKRRTAAWIVCFASAAAMASANARSGHELYDPDGVVNDYRYFEVMLAQRDYSPRITILEDPQPGQKPREFSYFGTFYGVTLRASYPIYNFYYVEAGGDYLTSAVREGKNFYHRESNSYVEEPGFDATSINLYVGGGVYRELTPRITGHLGGRLHYMNDEHCLRDWTCDEMKGLGVSGLAGAKYWFNHWLRFETEVLGTYTSRSGYVETDGAGGYTTERDQNFMLGFEAKAVILSGQWQVVPSFQTTMISSSDYLPESTQISIGIRYSY